MGSSQLYKRHKTTVQVLHQYGISSIFLPGSEVPEWFSHQDKGTLLSFVVPAASAKILGFGLCVAYAFNPRQLWHVLFVEISNKTKGLKWQYRPQLYGVPDANHELMLWSSLWMFKEGELEAGDEMEVSMNLSFGVIVKEIGIRLIHQHEDHDTERLCVWDEEDIGKADPFVKFCNILHSAPEEEQCVLFSEFDKLQKLQGDWELSFGCSRDYNLHRQMEIMDRLAKYLIKIVNRNNDLMILSKLCDGNG